MKINSIIIVLALVSMVSCKYKKLSDLNDQFNQRQSNIAQFRNSQKESINFVGGPFSDSNIAKKYIASFRKDSSVLDSLQGGKATNSIWIDSATIAHFATLIITDGCDGVRLYFSKYDPNVVDAARNILYKHSVDYKYSFVMVATKPGQKDDHVNYCYIKPGDFWFTGLYDYNKPCPPNCNSVSPVGEIGQ